MVHKTLIFLQLCYNTFWNPQVRWKVGDTMRATFSITELIWIITLTVLGLMLSIVMDFPLLLGIAPGFSVLLYFARIKSISWKGIISSCMTGLKRNKDVAWLLVFIGILLPTWAVAGTIDDLNLLFLTLISTEHFFLIAFLITGIMSFIVGSSIGSLSIVGVPMMATAEQLGISVFITAGALVSGSFIGDRTSPLSSSFFLLAHSLEVSAKAHFRAILPTMFITAGVSGLLYSVLDWTMNQGPGEHAVNAGSQLHLPDIALSLIPPVVLLVMILSGIPMRRSFTAGILAGMSLIIVRNASFTDWFTGSLTGVDNLNGLWQMLPFILFILAVGMFSQMIEDTELLQPVINRFLTETRSLFGTTRQSIGIATAVSVISPNQAFPIIVTARSLLPHWRTHFSQKALSRVLADSTVVFAGIVPWSLLAILNSSILGVPVWQYVPFAFFLTLSPLITIIYSLKKAPR